MAESNKRMMASRGMSHSMEIKKNIFKALPAVFFLLLALTGILWVLFRPSPERIEYDFRYKEIASAWQLHGAGQLLPEDDGVSIKPGGGDALFLSPDKGSPLFLSDKAFWRMFPYIKIEMVPETSEREIGFLWKQTGGPGTFENFAARIPARATDCIIDVTHLNYGGSRYSLGKKLIGRFGFLFFKNIKIRNITLQSALSFPDFFKLALRSFFAPEVFHAYTINFLIGPVFFGKSLLYAIPVVFFFLCLIFGDPLLKKYMIVSGLVSFLIFDLQFSCSLWRHSQYSRGVSAWHEPRSEEYASRFGKDFADLAGVFEKKIPPGAKIFFPEERKLTVRGEWNWIAFQFYPEFRSVPVEKADYVFFYFPEHCQISGTGDNLTCGGGEKGSVRIKPLYEKSQDVKLLEVVHA